MLPASKYGTTGDCVYVEISNRYSHKASGANVMVVYSVKTFATDDLGLGRSCKVERQAS